MCREEFVTWKVIIFFNSLEQQHNKQCEWWVMIHDDHLQTMH